MLTISIKSALKEKLLTANYPLIFALFTISVAVLVLLGWALNIPLFKSVLPNAINMKANSAICMILCGLSILYLSLNFQSYLFQCLIIFQSLIVLVIALLTLAEYILQSDFGIQQLLFNEVSAINAGRMSPSTAFCFLCLGISITLMLPRKRKYLKKPIAAALSSTVALISGLVFFSYIFNLLLNSTIFNYARMGIHTSFLFLLLSCSIILLIKKEKDFGWALNATITGVCIAWLISLAIASLAYYNFISQIKKNNDEIIHTQKVIRILNDLFIALEYFDLNEQNYSTTRNKVFLENRIKTQDQIHTYFKNINQYIEESSEKSKLNQLKSIVFQEMELINKKTDVKGQAIPDIELLNNQIVDLHVQIKNEKNRMLDTLEDKQSALSTQAILLSPLGIYFSVSMLAIGIFILNAHLLERRKIRAKQKQLAEIVESSEDGIIGKDLNSIVTSWNTGAEHVFGYTSKEMVGKSIQTLIPPDRIAEEADIIKRISNGEKIEHFETVRKRKDGKPIDVSVTISPIKNDKNEIIGASKIVRDITEKKNLELQLRQNQKLSAIGQLTGGVAHDFNNLLGIILGNLDLLERNLADNPEALKRIKNALNAASRGADLTKRLLAFSRLQHLNPTPTILSESINNVVQMASRILGKNIEVTCQLDSAIPPAMIDATELESALLNLAINARDAMPNGGKLVFSTKLLNLDNNYLAVQSGDIKPGTYACISVIDSGEGIAPEVIEHVFEPFFTTKSRDKGTGMGLSMVYGFIKQSGGIIRIYSEVNHGTTISLYLPLAGAEEVQTIKSKQKTYKKQKFSGKVLVVDDEVDLLELASTYLKEMGFEVFHATDGMSALELFKQEPNITLVVTDVIMPGEINGIELSKRIRQLNKDILIIYTSGFLAQTLSEKSIDIEEILINKPYNQELFVSTISCAIQNKHA